MELKSIRKNIDALDDKLIGLFTERMDLAAQIAAGKNESGAPILNEQREKEIIERLSAKVPEKYSRYIEPLYETIFQISRSYQHELLYKRK